MPIYEYQCPSCGHEMEALRKISDAPLTDCPACGSNELKKKVSAAAFRLKGGGWYETDFKTGDNKKNIAGDKKADSSSGNTADSGSTAAAGSDKKSTGSDSKTGSSAAAS